MQDNDLVDGVYRSRNTILDMLEKRDFITTPYRNISPKEITYMVHSEDGQALRMDLTHKDGEKRCVVLYYLNKIKQRLRNILINMNDPDKEDYLDPATTEVIMMVVDEVVDTFHQTILENYVKNKGRVFVFQIKTLINDPTKHVLTPLHEKVPAEEHTDLLKTWYAKTKMQLPLIRYHMDMQARYLGLVPGDIVKITRPSPSAGETVLYRVCGP